jgi:DNA-binding CsgD family transcriptional regulator
VARPWHWGGAMSTGSESYLAERNAKIARLAEAGLPPSVIGERFGVSAGTVRLIRMQQRQLKAKQREGAGQ